jgi:fibronectin-binding autotransporter adhesin
MSKRLFKLVVRRLPHVVACTAWMLCTMPFAAPSWAANNTWIGGNVDWVDGAGNTNWNSDGFPVADEPDPDDVAIFNTANSVNLGSNNAVMGLTLSGGIDLFANDFDLLVDGLVQVAGASTNLFIEGAAGSVNADDIVINASGIVELRGGTLTMDEEVGTALIDLNAGGFLQGNGLISFADNPGVATAMLVNDGTLTALSRGLTIFSPPPVGTLTITDVGVNGRLDLDGTGEAGVVNVNRNQTLFTEMLLADAFNGTLNLFHNSTFQFNQAFTLAAGGSIVVDNGFVAGGLGFGDTPADTAFFDSGALIQTGGTINVVDTDGTLQIDAPFTMSGGTFANSGTVIFNGTTSITAAGGYAPSSLDAQTIVNAAVTINHAAADFNWDGSGAADTTINGTGSLTITADQIDTGNDTFGGTLNLNDGGDLSVNVTGTSWTSAGAIIKNGAAESAVTGDRVVVTGQVQVNAGTLDMPQVETTSTSQIVVNGVLEMGGGSEFGGGSITGTGTLFMEGTSVVSANTTINTATFDWDGNGTGTNHTINSGVTFTINSPTFDNDGVMNDPVNLAGSGSTLIVNNAFPWAMVAAINANNAGVGTATIGGTSRLILTGANADLNVNGNTTISAPLTLDASSFVDIDDLMLLDATNAVTYSGGTIDGLGTYSPGSTNLVTADSTINPDVFDFDGGSWTVESGAELTFNVVDYDTTATNAFDSTITLNNGAIFANTADAEFVMDGTLNMNASGGFSAAEWSGDAIDIGNDAGVLDADINVTGDGNVNSQARFFVPVDFNSDADVNVPAGASLIFNSSVNFDTVNGVNNAEFTGSGRITFSNVVNVNEAATLNMAGSTVDLDGVDGVGDFINIDAPLTINAATLLSFGQVNGGGGVNTLDVNNSVGLGVLTVNLDDPNAEWTLNGPGVMNLVNDNVDATLLAGSDVNINGVVNVTGDVRTTARLDIAGTVNINTAGQPLRLAGGAASDHNTLAGGTITGAGLLGADTARELRGFGTINTAIDFDGTANLRAEDGTLTINGAIVDVNVLGAFGANGVLNIPAAWNSSTGSGAGSVTAVSVIGGMLQGGTITNDNGTGIRGFGTVTSRVINNTQLVAGNAGGTMIFQTAGNDNDWDGTTNTGELIANAEAVLELRDVGAAHGFTGTVRANPGGHVFTNGFALDFNPGSTLDLAGGIYESTSSTDLGGTVTIAAGPESTIEVANNFFLTFETGSTTTLNGNLRVVNNNINVEAGAAFSGAGALIVDDASQMVVDNGATVNVLVVNEGGLHPGGLFTVGAVTVKDYSQASTGVLNVTLDGTLPNQFDRLLATGIAQIVGRLNVGLDVGFNPALGATFDILSTAFGVSGTFSLVDYDNLPAGKTFRVDYLPSTVRLTVVNKPIFSADFDDDGDVDASDLGIWKTNFNLNQLGDADGDNDSDGNDFLLWQRQLGSKPTAVAASTAVPEPGAAILLVVAAGSVRRICRNSWRKPSARK